MVGLELKFKLWQQIVPHLARDVHAYYYLRGWSSWDSCMRYWESIFIYDVQIVYKKSIYDKLNICIIYQHLISYSEQATN